ncbi:MAG: hypothetical protein PHY56_03245 [Candidatus Omnitrophica bacterium]|nr:hypothetical protein [Candidatus Omnitrophota bacterium]
MKKIYFKIVLIVMFLLVIFGFGWSKQQRMLPYKNIISIAIETGDPSVIYAASENYVYKTNDSAKTWEKIYNTDNTIRKLYINRLNNAVYILTDNGLYESRDKQDSWKRIFIGSSTLENNCLCLAISDKALYLGTRQGLFISYDSGKGWRKFSDNFSDSIISCIVINQQEEDIVYVASEKGVFSTQDDGQHWKRIYVIYGSEMPNEDFSDYDGEINEQLIGIYSMAISYRVYIATRNGIFFTENNGGKWHNVTNLGLPSFNVRSILISQDEDKIFIATDKGVFELDKGKWQNISSNFKYQDFCDLVLYDNETILAAGKGGLCQINLVHKESATNIVKVTKEESGLKYLFMGEPTIEEVQRVAIKYADADINKIRNWRRQSRAKAFFPDVSVSYNKSVYGSSTGAMAVGPRDWSLGLSWDVADLVWNSDETSIDSRSRLTVQLRQDILDQITRLYYERKRLKSELFLSPPKDELERLYRELEIEEVTANLDGLTNGYFSKVTYHK